MIIFITLFYLKILQQQVQRMTNQSEVAQTAYLIILQLIETDANQIFNFIYFHYRNAIVKKKQCRQLIPLATMITSRSSPPPYPIATLLYIQVPYPLKKRHVASTIQDISRIRSDMLSSDRIRASRSDVEGFEIISPTYGVGECNDGGRDMHDVDFGNLYTIGWRCLGHLSHINMDLTRSLHDK